MPHGNEFVGLDRWQSPGGFSHDQFDGLETFAVLFVVTVADADQPGTVKLDQLSGSFLSRFQLRARLHKRSSLLRAMEFIFDEK